MAIRSTNLNRAARQEYDPKASGSGPPGRMTKQEQWDRREQDYGMSPWFAAGDQMPWSGPPGQQRGQRAPIYTPDAGDPRNAGYWKNQSTPEQIAADNAAAKQRYGAQQDLLYNNPEYMAAKNAGDLKAQIAAMTALKQQMQQQRFVDQGGTAQTWQDRYKNEDNWMRPGVGGAVPAPSGGGRTLPPPASTAAAPQALPPSANPMMQGYLGGISGQVSGGSGQFGQFNPMQSKSGMGQDPNMGPAMSTGNPMGPAPMGGDLSFQNTGGYFNPALFSTQGRGMGGGSYVGRPGDMNLGQLQQMLFASQMGGMGQGGMGYGGYGGYNPTAQGMNPFAALMGGYY